MTALILTITLLLLSTLLGLSLLAAQKVAKYH